MKSKTITTSIRRISRLTTFFGLATLFASVNAQVQGSLTANGPFCGADTGQLTWTATAGTGPFTVVYNDGTANRTDTGIVSGVPFGVFTNPVTNTTTYRLVSVTDSLGDTASSGFTVAAATITVNTALYANISGGTSPVCPNSLPGTFISVDTGGSILYSDTPVLVWDFYSGNVVGGAWGNLIQASNGLMYGLTANGGAGGYGTLFSFNPNPNSLIELFSWNMTNGANPHGSLIQASDGLLYGTTENGGANQYGTIFSYNISTGVYTDLHDFAGNNDGRVPMGSLVQASNGILYGMTWAGGPNEGGIIFMYDPSSNFYGTLYYFDIGVGGSSPQGSLIQATNGLLYGMTVSGGNYHDGIIFSYDPVSTRFKELYDMNGTDGAEPLNSLIQASDGLLYGMTDGGGAYGVGAIFSYDITDSLYTKLVDFSGTNGGGPSSNLFQASDGLLYGTSSNAQTQDAGGNVFSYNTSTGIFHNIFNWPLYGTKGYLPKGSLMQASDGLMYGMLFYGAATDDGGIYTFGREGQYRYQWFLNDTATTDTTRTFTPGPISANTTIYCQASSGACIANSNVITIIVSPPAAVTISISGDTIRASGGNTYQWLMNGDTITGATSAVFIAPHDGSYSVEITDGGGCRATSSVVDITGIGQLPTDHDITIYPNPSNGNWQLSVNDGWIGSVAEVFDAAGQLVFKSEIQNSKSEIRVTGLASGVYQLRITAQGYSTVRKLVKM